MQNIQKKCKNILGNIFCLMILVFNIYQLSYIQIYNKKQIEYYSNTIECKNKCCISLEDCNKECLLLFGKKIYREIEKTYVIYDIFINFLLFLPIFLIKYINSNNIRNYKIISTFSIILIIIKIYNY
jgi:hypothetical protein